MAAADRRDTPIPGTVPLGRVRGVPILLHYSWFLIGALLTLSLAAHFRATQPAWTAAMSWGIAALTTGLFFATLLLHELSHAAVAAAYGLPVGSITLFALGGMASIRREAATARAEFLIAVVGPLTSVAIGLLCLVMAWPLGWSPRVGGSGPAAAVLGWLGSTNLLLAIFNLIPGYPLDGGRILRAAVWGLTHDMHRATRTAARVGQVIAVLFIAWGFIRFFAGGGLGGLWLAFIGWFLLSAAQASHATASVGSALRGVPVAAVMAHDCAAVDPAATVQQVVDDVLLRTGWGCVVVRRGQEVLGLLTAHDIRDVDRTRWSEMTARDVMRPLVALSAVTPSTPVSQALETMAREDTSQLPVVADGRLEGIVTRGRILRLLRMRAELQAG